MGLLWVYGVSLCFVGAGVWRWVGSGGGTTCGLLKFTSKIQLSLAAGQYLVVGVVWLGLLCVYVCGGGTYRQGFCS